MTGAGTSGITIGQAARFAGVTTRTVRWYHQHGLIKEPDRDSSGYRRYTSSDLLRLVQVRTLAEAGVPLARIPGLLDDDQLDDDQSVAGGRDADRFAASIAAVEEDLTARIDDLVARRDMLRRLTTGDRVLLPERATAILDRMPELGFDTADVAAAWEGLVLVRAVTPDYFDQYLTQVETATAHPDYLALVKLSLDAETWQAEDPRIEQLASALVDYYLAHPELQPIPSGSSADAVQLDLLAHHREEHSPAWARLTALLHDRLRAAGFDVPR